MKEEEEPWGWRGVCLDFEKREMGWFLYCFTLVLVRVCLVFFSQIKSHAVNFGDGLSVFFLFIFHSFLCCFPTEWYIQCFFFFFFSSRD